jgi:hypothetical protein
LYAGFISKAFHKEQMKSTGQLRFRFPFGYSFTMDLKTIQIEEINIEDETYRISEDLDSKSILASLKKVGQLNPVLLLDHAPRKIVVCGFRRIRALKELNAFQVLAWILSENSHGMLQRFELSLWDNLSHRQLNPLENARLLYKLRNVCNVSEEALVEAYLPLLGLEPHESVLKSYLRLDGIHSALRSCLLENRLTFSSVDILAAMPYPVQGRIALLMDKIRLSASLQRKVLDILEELSAMAGESMDAPLDNPAVPSILDDPDLSPSQKGGKLHEVLYRMKYPELSKALDRFQAGKKALALPGSIRIIPHPFFENEDLHVEFQAANAERFRELTNALQKAAQSSKLDKLFRVV